MQDNGIGIPAEKLPHVFDLFMRATRSVDHQYGGLGIGLTLVRRLAELHGGSVAARSEGAGSGSEFIVRLPGATSGPSAESTDRPRGLEALTALSGYGHEDAKQRAHEGGFDAYLVKPASADAITRALEPD